MATCHVRLRPSKDVSSEPACSPSAKPGPAAPTVGTAPRPALTHSPSQLSCLNCWHSHAGHCVPKPTWGQLVLSHVSLKRQSSGYTHPGFSPGNGRFASGNSQANSDDTPGGFQSSLRDGQTVAYPARGRQHFIGLNAKSCNQVQKLNCI